MRYGFMVFLMLLGSVTSTLAQVSIGIGLPSVSIGINLPMYPELVQVPDYPVYYAPRLNSNFFFYDGLYWVYQDDDWYASDWYNGPWERVAPQVVPLFVLRIPVRYYRVPPVYFRGWQADAPPRWGVHWGPSWARGRSGWDRWNRSSAPAAAPLPDYQRHYSGDRYPRVEQQRELHGENYRYQPRDVVVRQRFQEQEQAAPRAPAPSQRERQPAPQERNSRPQEVQRRNPPPPQSRGDEEAQRPVPNQSPPRQREPVVQEQRPQQLPQPPREAAQQPRPRHGQGQGQGQGRGRVIEDEERGPGRSR